MADTTKVLKLDVAEIIEKAYKLRELADRIIDILVPDGDDAPACKHPDEKVQVEATMDDDPDLYTCTLCGATQAFPFGQEE